MRRSIHTLPCRILLALSLLSLLLPGCTKDEKPAQSTKVPIPIIIIRSDDPTIFRLVPVEYAPGYQSPSPGDPELTGVSCYYSQASNSLFFVFAVGTNDVKISILHKESSKLFHYSVDASSGAVEIPLIYREGTYEISVILDTGLFYQGEIVITTEIISSVECYYDGGENSVVVSLKDGEYCTSVFIQQAESGEITEVKIAQDSGILSVPLPASTGSFWVTFFMEDGRILQCYLSLE